jgi:hypothetical protein
VEEINALSSDVFLKMFRMPRSVFQKLYDILEPFLHDTEEKMAIVMIINNFSYYRCHSLINLCHSY